MVPVAAFDDIALKSHAQEAEEPSVSTGVVLNQQLSRPCNYYHNCRLD